jgi:glycosyltransferase involved in cell wall biosynthesis
MLQHFPATDAMAQLPHLVSSAARTAAPARICFPFGGGAVGGSHISAIKLIQGLDRTRFTPLIVLHYGDGQLGQLLRSEGLDYIILSERRFFGESRGVPQSGGATSFLSTCVDQWRLARFLKGHGVKIVHSNEGAMHISWALPARLAGAKLLWHHRGMPDARGVRFLAPVIADRIVGVSQFALSKVRRGQRTARKTAVVYSPFDTDADPIDQAEAHRSLIAELGVDPQTRLVGFFGNLVERKRPMLFVETVARMAEKRPSLPFIGLMFGSALEPGVKDQLMERARALGVSDRLRLMGFRYNSAELMAACDIHAVPAIDEPFGRSLIEAMLLSTPVVAAASGGNLEAIDQGVTGLLSAADDATAMADAILQLLDAPDQAAAIATAALNAATQRYGADRHVAQISAIYQSLLGSARMADQTW